MNERPAVKTMRLRYAGVCASCGRAVEKGETAHYLSATKSVRCASCGPGEEVPVVAPQSGAVAVADPETQTELMQGVAARSGSCGDCERRIARGAEALIDSTEVPRLCLECIELDMVHVLGVAGGGARREHAKRLERHQTKVRASHPPSVDSYWL